ncbi:MAG: hypothetical protein NTW07_07375 [candidate division Zixibacteria bacterium]|nr:hypothetical protein [candidate division Zixibacteria bacterium]
MPKRNIITWAVVGILCTAVTLCGIDLGVVSTADRVRFEVYALDSSGFPALPDSGHVLVWYQGEATANSASYTNRWTSAGAGSAEIDSVRYASYTYYYFVDSVADIDNNEGNGVYTGVVVLYTKLLPTPNRFTFTVAGDELSDYWAEVKRIGDSINAYDGWIARQATLTGTLTAVVTDTTSTGQQIAVMPDHWTAADSNAYQGSAAGLDSTDVARAVWNAPAANHTVPGTYGAYLDTTVSSFTVGSGAFSTTLFVYDTSNAQAVPEVRLAVWNIGMTSLKAIVMTGTMGSVGINVDSGAYVISGTAPGYLFAAYDTVVVSGSQIDTIRGSQFDPGTPLSPGLCRVYGYLFTSEGQAESGARISAWLPSGVTRLENLIISPTPVSVTTNEYGYFYLDLIPSSLLNGEPKYEITINRTDGTILRKRVTVPDTAQWQLAW